MISDQKIALVVLLFLLPPAAAEALPETPWVPEDRVLLEDWSSWAPVDVLSVSPSAPCVLLQASDPDLLGEVVVLQNQTLLYSVKLPPRTILEPQLVKGSRGECLVAGTLEGEGVADVHSVFLANPLGPDILHQFRSQFIRAAAMQDEDGSIHWFIATQRAQAPGTGGEGLVDFHYGVWRDGTWSLQAVEIPPFRSIYSVDVVVGQGRVAGWIFGNPAESPPSVIGTPLHGLVAGSGAFLVERQDTGWTVERIPQAEDTIGPRNHRLLRANDEGFVIYYAEEAAPPRHISSIPGIYRWASPSGEYERLVEGEDFVGQAGNVKWGALREARTAEGYLTTAGWSTVGQRHAGEFTTAVWLDNGTWTRIYHQNASAHPVVGLDGASILFGHYNLSANAPELLWLTQEVPVHPGARTTGGGQATPGLGPVGIAALLFTLSLVRVRVKRRRAG